MPAETPKAIKNNPAVSLEKLRRLARKRSLETPETYRAAIHAVLDVLNTETGYIQLADLPTIIIPDIHARRTMLIDILSHPIEDGPYTGRQVFDLLQKGLINVVCVGDIVHSEVKTNWVINEHGDWTPELLEKEMVRSLGAAAMIMHLKMQYAGNFHCLRGNHDDIIGELAPNLRKFVGVQRENGQLKLVNGKPVMTAPDGEAGIVRNWVVTRGVGWGQSFLELWAEFDQALPIFAQGVYFVVSHYLPGRALSREEIEDKHRSKDATLQLTFLQGEVSGEAMTETLDNLGILSSVIHWFHGHRAVPSTLNDGRYATSFNGLKVRLNNQKNYVFAYVPGSIDQRRFDAERDVYIKKPAEPTFHR